MTPIWLCLCLLALSCAATDSADRRDDDPPRGAPVNDPHSFSRPAEVRQTHLSLDALLDFDAGIVRGTAQLAFERRDSDAPLWLDTQGLVIEAVEGEDGRPRSFRLEDEVPRFGAPLRIELQPGDRAVVVRYRTTPGAEALQWLAPEQTAGGVAPFLFTQGQAILTRSWIPIQDSPGARLTYDARVRAPEGTTVVMSAESRGRDADGAWLFGLDLAIPPYLIALAAGRIESRDLSPRCRVWAEPETVEAAAWEFADTEAMIAAAEELFGPYRWGRYDLLILPPAFPYGGMENPLLTFLTPTVLAGDRSLVSIIAHELAHSWSGNLVTNATWSDFWLNEGTTVYFEQRIMERLYGRERRDLEAAMGRDGLLKLIARQEPWENVLEIELDGRHPDDGFSGVPYQKGAALLTRLEELFGRERFDAFLRAWFDEHAFQSVTTAEFERFLNERLLEGEPALAAQLDLDEWLRAPGLPADAPREESDALARVEAEVQRLVGGATPAELDTDGWVSQQWVHFVRSLPESFGPEELARLDASFAFTQAGNHEVLCAWLERSVRSGYRAADARLERFLTTVGRRKYLQPLYEALLATEDGGERARALYRKARSHYHAVSAMSLDRLLGVEPASSETESRP